MSTDFDTLTNRGEYLSAHYFAEQLGPDLRKLLFTGWKRRESDTYDSRPTPRDSLPALRGDYMTKMRGFFVERAGIDEENQSAGVATAGKRPATHGDPEWRRRLTEWHRMLLAALGFPDATDQTVTVHKAGREHEVRVLWRGANLLAVECGWAATNDDALEESGGGRALHPLRVNASESYETGQRLAAWLFQGALDGPDEDPPRFVLLLCGGVIVLADRRAWAEGRYLAADVDAALERNDIRKTGELATIAALFSRDMLLPADDGKGPLVDELLGKSNDNAIGVTGELREGLQRSVEVIANEVLYRLEQAEVEPRRIERPGVDFARELTSECLRYLYRIIFLLYAEARPELGILPADDGSYEAGYSVARLRDLVERDEVLVEEEAKNGFHLFASLNLLFGKVNEGHRVYGTEEHDDLPGDDEETRRRKAELRSEDKGLRFEALRSTLFEPASIRLIGRELDHPHRTDDSRLDLRPRNSALHQVLRLLTMKKAARQGERGGFISYRNLGINQLGAVYEGLMSYTGIIAEEDLCEVAKDGKPEKGSWLVPSHRQREYPDQLVEYGEQDAVRDLRGVKKYPAGTFVYRLAGRARETSASYYTPESLTQVTVELALEHRLDQERDADGQVVPTRAADLLKYRICEPALGSGAFLNEAINQVAAEYLRRRQRELGRSIPTSEFLAEKQKVKAYIALHNSYGVDLNATGVELAEVSLWLNTMHPGMRAPWFGLHLRRGNSLVGARRSVYAASDVTGREWLRDKNTLAPTPVPFVDGDASVELPEDAIHHFLLPSSGWASVTRASGDARKLVKELADEDMVRLAGWRRGMLKPPKRGKTDSKTKKEPRSQFTRLRDVARRAEFLWSLVVKRMEISESEIARRIQVWGSDEDDPEYAFLRRPEGVVEKEKVYKDLFENADTPYQRLKTVMDTWCALWFWPLHGTDLLEGESPAYREGPVVQGADSVSALLGQTPVVSEPIPEPEEKAEATDPEPEGTAQRFYEKIALFSVPGEQTSLADMVPGESEPEPERVPIKPPKPRGGGRKAAIPERRAQIPLKDLDDWIDFLEAMLGAADKDDDTILGGLETLAELDDYESQLPDYMGMDRGDPQTRFPWLSTVRNIAEEQGFLHWELDFALVFAEKGGFDLQIGNPPWVRPEWKEAAVLAESDPWFALTEKPPAAEKRKRRSRELEKPEVRERLLDEVTVTVTMADYLAAPQVYPLITGSQPDLYRAFMCQSWDHQASGGTIGLIHPDTHFSGEKDENLREAAYRRLRVHADFVNAGNRFFPPPVGRSSHFGLHVYGGQSEISFDHLSWLFSVDALRLSPKHSGEGEAPGVKLGGKWDERPHGKRVIRVDRVTLRKWQRLLREDDVPVDRARLLSPVSSAEDPAISALIEHPIRLAHFQRPVSRGWDESGAKKPLYGEGKNVPLIDYNHSSSGDPIFQVNSWAKVVFKGPQIGVSNPFFKQPSQGKGELRGLDHILLESSAIPESEYRAMDDMQVYRKEQHHWIDEDLLSELRMSKSVVEQAREEIAKAQGCLSSEVEEKHLEEALAFKAKRPYTDFYRLAWRERVAPDTERSLYAALIPPGAAHVNAVRSTALPTLSGTTLLCGFWSSLPVDYLVRTAGVDHLDVSRVRGLPAPEQGHPFESALLLRTLRLNCLTDAYSDLWEELYDPRWTTTENAWARTWPYMKTRLHEVTPLWERGTPLRTEYARRAALVEMDALVAVWLGIDADTLITMYRARFPIMQDFDQVTWFDSKERKIAGNRYTYGHGQEKAHYEQLLAYNSDKENAPAPDGYTAPFYEVDREKEMREAHDFFSERLNQAIERGEWSPQEQDK